MYANEWMYKYKNFKDFLKDIFDCCGLFKNEQINRQVLFFPDPYFSQVYIKTKP